MRTETSLDTDLRLFQHLVSDLFTFSANNMDPSSFIGVIWDAAKCFCGCVQREADFIFDLEANLQLLEDKSKKLEDIKKDVELQVEKAQNNPEMIIYHRVNGWLQRVDRIQQEIKDIDAQGAQEIQNKCSSKWCSNNCMSSYKLGQNVAKILKDVDELATEGKSFCKDFVVAHKVTPKAIELPLDTTVGLDVMFDKVWNSIEAENVGVIGLYGMGGVGKTTLLKKINNELRKRRLGFNFVMWVVVSKEPNLDSIMDNIRKLVGIRDDTWNSSSNQDEKAAKIYAVLKQEKFALLLDDIWDKLDLKLVGVPHPRETNFQSKVLFTTRLEDVCAKMQAKTTLKVETLTEEEASKLFCMKVGEETLSSHPSIPNLAKKMAKECKRLPLALIVVGSAMAGVKSVGAWEHSINNLTSSSWTATDLETKVFSILKFSYDKLDQVQKRCFLYCALYPEDCVILVPDLIDKWMWENFLCKNMTKSVQDIRGHGESIIEKLKLSCLLESVEDDLFMNCTVKMHDMIRDMALWIAHDRNNMELVQRTSIMNEWESRKIQDPPNATTLVLLKVDYAQLQCQLEDIKYMKRLKVLELNVRGRLLFVDIGCLVSLEYLSLLMGSFPGSEFFINLQNLTNLKFLSLKGGRMVTSCHIPLGVLSSLQQLRVFRLAGCRMSDSDERRILEELECLPNIEELCIQIKSEDGLNKLVESTKLLSCIYMLYIYVSYKNEMPLLSLTSMSKMKQLRQIDFSELNIRSGQSSFLFDTCCLTKLRSVTMFSCLIAHMTWLKYAPLLQQLDISECPSMEEVIKEGYENVDFCVFSSLVTLTLTRLPRLMSIHKAPLPFPSLKSINIVNCPKLKKLPFDSNSAKHKLTLIMGEENWWHNLEWDDPMAKHEFQSKFKAPDF